MSRLLSGLSHQFTHTQQVVIELVSSLALEYDCMVTIQEAGGDYVLNVVCDGDRSRIGTISAVKSMTVRGLMGYFEKAVMAKRVREGIIGESMMPGD